MILHCVAVTDIAKPLQLIIRLRLAKLNRVAHAVGARILCGVRLLDRARLRTPGGHFCGGELRDVLPSVLYKF
jgi:hypothetical protein